MPLDDLESLAQAYQTYRRALGGKWYDALQRAPRQFLDQWPRNQWMTPPPWTFTELTAPVKAFSIFLLVANEWHPGYDFLLEGRFTSLWRSLRVTPWAEDLQTVEAMAIQLGFHPRTRAQLIPLAFVRLFVQSGRRLHALTPDDLRGLEEAITAREDRTQQSLKHYWLACQQARQVLYHLGIFDHPPVHRSQRLDPWEDRLEALPPAIRQVMTRYLSQMAPLRRPGTLTGYASTFRNWGAFLSRCASPVQTLHAITRREHLEPWMQWNTTREKERARPGPMSHEHQKNLILDLKTFFESITEWEWPEAPGRVLIYRSDLPRLDDPVPRALTEDQDRQVLAAIRAMADPLRRLGLEILRWTGLRIGELVDLPVDCVQVVAGQGAWLKVPLGKLRTERLIPLDDATVALFQEVQQHREDGRTLPHPDTGIATAFLFVRHGKRVSREYFRDGLALAVEQANIQTAAGQPLRVTPHVLRHTFATCLMNAGLSLPTLMKLLGHRTAEMSLRYGQVYDTTVRAAWEQAQGHVRQAYSDRLWELPVLPHVAGGSAGTDWMAQHRLKTRLAHGYCLRDIQQHACPYANICERCSAFVPLPEARPILEQELVDTRLLLKDAELRQWENERQRHQVTIERLELLLADLPLPVSPKRSGGRSR